jgi:dCTP deaminase
MTPDENNVLEMPTYQEPLNPIHHLPRTIYSDKMIKLSCQCDDPMISPFVDHLISVNPDTGVKVVSYGLSSYGYDLRIAEDYVVLRKPFYIWAKIIAVLLFTVALMNLNYGNHAISLLFLAISICVLLYRSNEVLDPKNFPKDLFKERKAKNGKIVVPPHSTILAYSMERFKIPDDTSGLCVGKSTYARLGLSCLNTPVEAGWEGYLTLEFTNGTNMPIIMYAGEGALQLVLFKGPKAEVNYRDRKGKYMNQPAQVVTPTV